MEAAAPPTTERFSLRSFDRTLDIDATHLTASANELLMDAQRLCYEKNHNLVEPAHAAWVLFTGAAIKPVYETGSRILTRAKVQTEACRVFLEEELQLCDTDRPAAEVRYSHSFVEFLKDAVFEAEAYRDSVIGLDHLAIALAINLSEYGSHVGFNELSFRAAAESVRGLGYHHHRPTLGPEIDSPTDSNGSSGGSLGIDLESYGDRLSLLAGSMLDEDESVRDRLSPPSDIPSPPDSPRRCAHSHMNLAILCDH